ncbi:peroxisomal succinyl-coenzyme A thioesterase-like [Huso huso]|uniref:Peroxisomal succinyl-coenzyme A thioesterase-like n=1 Tax=Huso huso TaxID=61971 RepID=A0ABR0ZCX9_HUSHU
MTLPGMAGKMGEMDINDASLVIVAHPTRGLVDEKFHVDVLNLRPHQPITLHSVFQSEENDFWEAYGHYISDSKGMVKADETESLGGSFTGKDPMGLIWSMKPVPGSRTGLRFRKRDVQTPYVVHISVFDGHISSGFNEKSALACTVMERWYMAPGVCRIDIRQDGVQGTLFLPPGPGPFPGILDLWGGGGGLVEYRSALLASHGYASLALEYLFQKNRSEKSAVIGEQYFEAAFNILKNHPKVASERVGLFGLSFGTSVALAMAGNSTTISPKCLVCVSGSHVFPVKESLSGVFAEMKTNMNKLKVDENNHLIWRNLILPIPTDPDKKVNVGNIRCPLLLIVGEDDQNWPAPECAVDIENMMKKAGNDHLLTKLSYPGTGHLIETPYSPHTRFSNFMLADSREKVIVLWGGETKPHAYAQEDSWRRILKFLERHLYQRSVL